MTDHCKRRVYVPGGTFNGRRCQRPTFKDGWCSIHHPDNEAKRKAARDERMAQKVEVWREQSRKELDMRKDALRYRWLREHPAFDTEAALGGMTPEEFDAAVDAAMGGDGASQPK